MENFSLEKQVWRLRDKEARLGGAEIHMKMSALAILYGQSLCCIGRSFLIHEEQVSI